MVKLRRRIIFKHYKKIVVFFYVLKEKIYKYNKTKEETGVSFLCLKI